MKNIMKPVSISYEVDMFDEALMIVIKAETFKDKFV